MEMYMADKIVPAQEITISPFVNQIFDWNTPDSDIYQSRFINKLTKIYGNDIVIGGLNISNVNITSGNTFNITITPGLATTHFDKNGRTVYNAGLVLQDNTLIEILDNVNLQFNCGAYQDTGIVIIYLHYRWLNTVENNPCEIRIGYVNSTQTDVKPYGWNVASDRTILAYITFTKNASNIITNYNLYTSGTVVIAGHTYNLGQLNISPLSDLISRFNMILDDLGSVITYMNNRYLVEVYNGNLALTKISDMTISQIDHVGQPYNYSLTTNSLSLGFVNQGSSVLLDNTTGIYGSWLPVYTTQGDPDIAIYTTDVVTAYDITKQYGSVKTSSLASILTGTQFTLEWDQYCGSLTGEIGLANSISCRGICPISFHKISDDSEIFSIYFWRYRDIWNTGAHCHCIFGGVPVGNVFFVDDTKLHDGQWHHFKLWIDTSAGVIIPYLDGVAGAEIHQQLTLSGNIDLRVGNCGIGAGGYVSDSDTPWEIRVDNISLIRGLI
jgi:hypothetical protein